MKGLARIRHFGFAWIVFAGLLFSLLVVVRGQSKDQKEKKQDEPVTSTLRIEVTAGDKNVPVGNASVYVRFQEPEKFWRKKKVEWDLKTNQDGTVKVKDVPRGKVIIQVVSPDWKPFGQYYYIQKAEEVIKIKLEKPPRWY